MTTRPTYTQYPNWILDSIPSFNVYEFAIISAICRQTFGWQRDRAKVSVSFIQKATGLAKSTVEIHMKSLIERGVLGREEAGDGFEYWLIFIDQPSPCGGIPQVVASPCGGEDPPRAAGTPPPRAAGTNKERDINKERNVQESEALLFGSEVESEKPGPKEFMSAYCELYELHFGGPYMVNGPKDMQALKRIIKANISLDWFKQVLSDAFTRTGYPFDSATSIASFISNWPKIIAAKAKPEKAAKVHPGVIRKQLEEVDRMLMSHPCNSESIRHRRDAGPELKAEYDQLNQRRAELQKSLVFAR